MSIERAPEDYARNRYDLIVVGGGIYGAMCSLEAVFRGLKPLLLERGDFGGATSFNSLRIIHGGLRYLQTGDLRRHYLSVRERRWMLANFPDLVTPLACLMPLYGDGLKRKSILRVALKANDLLSLGCNKGLPAAQAIPSGRVMSSTEVIERFPGVRTRGLQGAAIWHDASMPNSQRLIMELLHWSSQHGADSVNYAEVTTLEAGSGCVSGVRAVDRCTGAEHSFTAPVVINLTGPWCPEFAGRILKSDENWTWPSLAWNVLVHRNALSDTAVAVTPPRSGAPTYFLHPWKGRLFIGTGHASWRGPIDKPSPSADQIQEMLDDVNLAIPDVKLGLHDVDRVFCGLLPAQAPGSANIATSPTFVDHSRSGGPGGFFSVSGVKFTTARQVVATALDKIFDQGRARKPELLSRPASVQHWSVDDFNSSTGSQEQHWSRLAEKLIRNESAMSIRDIVFRRTDLWERPELAKEIAPKIGDMFPWPKQRKIDELAMLASELDNGWSPSQ